MQKDNYSLLIEKLDGFIRKFYINQLLRGSLYTVGLVLGLFILMNVLEYYFYFNTGVRTAMFWSFVAATAAAFWFWVAVPLMHYFRLGQVISHEQAAGIIGSHFSDVKDKLLNILQLKQQAGNAIYADLINASINQKSDEIKLVPFKAAIDLGKNRRHLRWALPPLLLLLFMIFGAPNILKEGTNRLWNSKVKFERPAPFRFAVPEDSLRVVQFSDYLLKVEVAGNVLPNEVFIDFGKVQYRLTKESANQFSYKFTNVQRDTEFKLFGGGVESDDFKLSVIKKPSILSFTTKLNFPDYIGRASEELGNVGDLVVPQGTNIGWVFNAQNTENLNLRFGADGFTPAKRFDDELFQFSRRALKDEPYKVFISNNLLPLGDSVGYSITVIPDLHPQIAVEEFKDSSNRKLLFFAGDASDDYGLLNLTFNFQVKKAKSGQLPLVSQKLEKTAGKQANFEHTWSLEEAGLMPGDEVSYYFEIFDNDGVNGSKSARTAVMQYRLPSVDELEKQVDKNSEQLQKDMKKNLEESRKIQEEMKKLRDKVLQQKELDWQSRKQLEKLMARQQELQEQMKQAKESFEENKKQEAEFQKKSEDILKKEEELQKLMEETMSEEMKQLMEDIQKLLQEMNKDEALEQMEKMQLNNEEMTKELSRLEELYKRLEVEHKLEQQIEKLEELAKEQEKLGDESEKGEKSAEDLKKEQEELNKQMEEIAKEQKDLEKKNEELKTPENIEKSGQEMQNIQDEQKDAKENLEKNQKGGASKKQKSAANKMKNLANKMKSDKQSGDMKQMEEDIAALRQLLENLVGLSFAQEQVLKDLPKTTLNTPAYVELGQQQFKIKDDFKLVEDSLAALAARNFSIEGIVTEKVTEIKSAIKNSLENIEERQVPQAGEQQQRSMKSLNDLALMLSEIMANMQQQMANSMPGSQSCQKPGNKKGEGQGKGKEPKDKMSKGQEGLGKSMEDLKKRLEQGKGKEGWSKEFAKMAAQQAALRNALREMQKGKQEQGKGSKALDELMNEMDKIEVDLVNKKLSNETLKRQQEVLTRLLEEERAEREREQDEKREAESAKQQPTKMPPALEEYLKKRRAELDLYRTVSPALKPYYKGLVEEYIKAGQK